MRRAVVCVVAIVVVALVATGCGCPMCNAVGKALGIGQPKDAPAEGAAAISQKTCPIMGKPIDPSVHADYQGTRVYFCCSGCIDKFNADPAKYLAKVKAQGGGS